MKPDLTERFLVSVFANALRAMLSPIYFITRTDMGVQFSGFVPVISSTIFYVCCAGLIAIKSKLDAAVAAESVFLALCGYVRNARQARKRRRVRDWSVDSWSTGRSLLEHVFRFVEPRLALRWGHTRWCERVLGHMEDVDFVYYVAEPLAVLLVAAGLYSIGSHLFLYAIVIAFALIVVRSEAQLRIYLQAHEVMDGKRFEERLKFELEGPSAAKPAALFAHIPSAPANRPPTDARSVAQRLSPELQLLLVRDRATRR